MYVHMLTLLYKSICKLSVVAQVIQVALVAIMILIPQISAYRLCVRSSRNPRLLSTLTHFQTLHQLHVTKNNQRFFEKSVDKLYRPLLFYRQYPSSLICRHMASIAESSDTMILQEEDDNLLVINNTIDNVGDFGNTSECVSTIVVTDSVEDDIHHGLLHPHDLFDGRIPYPKSLSPSAIAEFQACPQSFLFQYLYGLRQPTSAVLAKGTLCHTALEQLFDLDPPNRTIEHLHNLYRTAWSKVRLEEPYNQLFLLDNDATSQSNVTDAVANVTDSSSSSSSTSIQQQQQRDLKAESIWGKEALKLLSNYVRAEDPRHVPSPNPLHRELWVQAQLTVDPLLGSTGYTGSIQKFQDSSLQQHDNDPQLTSPDDDGVDGIDNDSITNGGDIESSMDKIDLNNEQGNAISKDNNKSTDRDNLDSPETFLVRGIVDRLDLVRVPRSSVDSKDNVVLRIVDYKTGAAPQMKYSRAMNQQIRDKAFFQLQLYALLLREKGAEISTSTKLDVRFLRLFYLTSVNQGRAQFLDFDLGETSEQRDAVLQQVHTKVANVWNSIIELVSTQDPTAFRGCDRSFCYCHKCRSRFVPGTLWEPENTNN